MVFYLEYHKVEAKRFFLCIIQSSSSSMFSSNKLLAINDGKHPTIDTFHECPSQTRLLTIGFCRDVGLDVVDSIIELIFIFVILNETLTNVKDTNNFNEYSNFITMR